MKELPPGARKEGNMISLADEQTGTNSSLLRKIKSLSNAPGWATFYETYAPLIERFAMKSGLTPVECQEVVQSTMIQVSKTISNFDRNKGSFKTWLFNGAKWRIVDALRARPKNTVEFERASHQHESNLAPESWEPSVSVFERLWEEEWLEQLRRDALVEVRKKVSGVQFQMFCLTVIEGHPAPKVAQMVGVRASQVHLARYRVGRLMKKELAKLLKLQS